MKMEQTEFTPPIKMEQTEFTPPIKMEQTNCSETSTHKIHMRRNHPKERIQNSEHSESLKSGS